MPPLRRAALLDSHIGDHLLGVLSAASAHSHAPEGERKGPIAKQWVGEVVADKHAMFPMKRRDPPHPPALRAGPSLSPRDDGRRGPLTRCVKVMVSPGSACRDDGNAETRKCRTREQDWLDVPEQWCGVCLPTLARRGSAE